MLSRFTELIFNLFCKQNLSWRIQNACVWRGKGLISLTADVIELHSCFSLRACDVLLLTYLQNLFVLYAFLFCVLLLRSPFEMFVAFYLPCFHNLWSWLFSHSLRDSFEEHCHTLSLIYVLCLIMFYALDISRKTTCKPSEQCLKCHSWLVSNIVCAPLSAVISYICIAW